MRQARHVPFVALALFAVSLASVPAWFALSVRDSVQLAGVYAGWCAAIYVAAAAGAVLAVGSFGPGEPMRPGWLSLSASYLVLVPVLLVLGPKAEGLYAAPVRAPWLLALGSIASGFLAVAAFLLLARSWSKSGLDASSPAGRLAAGAAAVAIAAALAGGDVRERLPGALQGDVVAAADVLTDLLDGAVFVVAVPVLRAALALGGGLVAWPWLFLTLSLVAWLGYDATTVFAAAPSLDPRGVRVAQEVLRTLAASFACVAGVAQKWVIGAARER
jgi:hypothetical protein